MEWLAESWFWVLIGVLFVSMHLFGHGGKDSEGKSGADNSNPGKPSGHQH